VVINILWKYNKEITQKKNSTENPNYCKTLTKKENKSM